MAIWYETKVVWKDHPHITPLEVVSGVTLTEAQDKALYAAWNPILRGGTVQVSRVETIAEYPVAVPDGTSSTE